MEIRITFCKKPFSVRVSLLITIRYGSNLQYGSKTDHKNRINFPPVIDAKICTSENAINHKYGEGCKHYTYHNKIPVTVDADAYQAHRSAPLRWSLQYHQAGTDSEPPSCTQCQDSIRSLDNMSRIFITPICLPSPCRRLFMLFLMSYISITCSCLTELCIILPNNQ